MSAVMDTPEILEHKEHDLYEEHDLQEEPPKVRGARGGFWHTVVQSLRRDSTHRLQRRSSADRSARRQLELPMARLAQEHPMLYLLGFFGMHHG
jgi:hypothetical protein